MAIISNNLTELNGQEGELQIDAKTVLCRLGFNISGEGDITFTATLPDGWTEESLGPFHTVFHGPNGEEVRSFVKRDFWDRKSFLKVYETN